MVVARSHRLPIRASLACCLALGMSVLAAASAAAKQPAPPIAGFDTVVATGDIGLVFNIDIAAQSGPLGENPTGTASFRIDLIPGRPPGDIFGPVTCLNVTGNTAVLNFHSDLIDNVVTISVTDNGDNGLDRINVLLGRAATDCSPVLPPDTLLNGRATVVDASPLPTSKEQCKNGDWAEVGFANQGQCIKFVNQP